MTHSPGFMGVDVNNLTPAQKTIRQRPIGGRLFVKGPPGSGKTTAGIAHLHHLLESGVPAESILILVPQRSLALPYASVLSQPYILPGGVASILTMGGLAQRMISLFWPVVAKMAGFAHPKKPAVYLTLETAQYYLARIVSPLLDEGYFQSIKLDRNRLLSQVLDNLNKAAVVGFDHTTLAERLKSAWVAEGDTAQYLIYDQAQDVANRFRLFCLQNNLLDFSLQFEVFTRYLWPSVICRQYLFQSYRHLIYDNVEEDVPAAHDIVHQWLPEFDSALLIHDTEAGYRVFLGADPENGSTLQADCDSMLEMDESLAASPAMQAFQQALDVSLKQHKPSIPLLARQAFSVSSHRYSPQMVDYVCQETAALVHEQGVQPEQIAILAPFLSDSLRFALMNRLEQLGVPAHSYRPSRSLRDEPATHCLLTLARCAHPGWALPPTHQEVRTALVQAIAGIDLVRADLLARICYHPKGTECLTSFDRIRPEMQERISFSIGERYQVLRAWLQAAAASPEVEPDVFLGRLFGEVLSLPGFGFHDQFDAAAVAARLIDSVRRFRWVVGESLKAEGRSAGREYIEMVTQGVLAAVYLPSWEEVSAAAVLVAPAHTFLMSNRIVSHQFWLDAGSLGWWERLYQPLTQPYVLSRQWLTDGVWTDVNENQTNLQTISRITRGLALRCRKHVHICTVALNEQGREQQGPFLLAIQRILRGLQKEGADV